MSDTPDKKQDDLTGVSHEISQMSDESKEKLLVQLNTQVNNYGGLLPNPEVLEKYDKLDPGVAARYFNEVFTEGQFRRQTLQAQQKSNNSHRAKAMIFGVLLALVMILSSTYLIINNHAVTGGILGGSVLLGVLSIFMDSDQSKSDKKQNTDKEL